MANYLTNVSKKPWLISILMWIKLRQIRAIDREYLELNHDLNRIEQYLELAQRQAENARIELLKKRKRLREEYLKLQGV